MLLSSSQQRKLFGKKQQQEPFDSYGQQSFDIFTNVTFSSLFESNPPMEIITITPQHESISKTCESGHTAEIYDVLSSFLHQVVGRSQGHQNSYT